MDGPERIWSLLDVETDRVDDRKCICNGTIDRRFVVDVSPDCFQSAAAVVDLISLGVTCGYSRREIPIKQTINDAAPEESGSAKDRDCSTSAQERHQQSLMNTNPLRGSHKLALKAARVGSGLCRKTSRFYPLAVFYLTSTLRCASRRS